MTNGKLLLLLPLRLVQAPLNSVHRRNRCYDRQNFTEVAAMAWDGDDLAGKMEEVFEQQQAAADARANRGTSSVEERARSAKFESLRLSRSRIMTQLANATNPAHRTMLESALKSINDEMAAE
ncbi:MAG: hypothetical protein ACREA9_09710 [Pyrinomonadaceae bacterium]